MQSELPTPSSAALEHSAALRRHLTEQIEASGGWISFADYMQLTLYAPGLGYYAAGARKFGAAGDFVTAPEISPLFSQCLAGQVAEVLAELGGGSVLEPGAGTGTMAADMLLELERLNSLPETYLILETSADLRERQQQTLQARAAHLIDRVVWLDSEPTGLRGVIVANEVADAIPVERFRIIDGVVQELGVALAGQEFVYAERAAEERFTTAIQAALSGTPADYPDGYESERCGRLPAWVQGMSGWLSAGVALLLDYGFPQHEYYLPERSAGTLRCYYRHRAHDDPFLWPGLQDLTAWVDFTLLAESAVAAGLEVAGFTTQANFLLASGLDARVSAQTSDPRAQVEMAAGLRQLLLPGEMGEAVKVIALSKGGIAAPSGMQGRDFRNRL